MNTDHDLEHKHSADPTHETETAARSPQLWIGSLADYNNGDLHGAWLDATQDPDALGEQIARLLATGPAARRGEVVEEYGIFDTDGFGPYRVGEYADLTQVTTVAKAIFGHDAEGQGDAFRAYLDLIDGDTDQIDNFADRYLGHHDNPENWAREVLEATDQELDLTVDQRIRPYVQIDYTGWARDAELDGSVTIEPANRGGVWIFHAT